MRQRRARMKGGGAWISGKENSLHASLDNVRKACSEAGAWGVKPITPGGFSLRMVPAHCNCDRRCPEGGCRPKFNDQIPNNRNQGSCAEKLDAAEQTPI